MPGLIKQISQKKFQQQSQAKVPTTDYWAKIEAIDQPTQVSKPAPQKPAMGKLALGGLPQRQVEEEQNPKPGFKLGMEKINQAQKMAAVPEQPANNRQVPALAMGGVANPAIPSLKLTEV